MIFRRKKEISHTFGKSVGIVWEYQGYGPEKTVCIVQIEKTLKPIRVTIYDPNDSKTTSVTNFFEQIATGVYHDHLSEYDPHQIQFYHRDTLGIVPQWGVKTVQLQWDQQNHMYIHPEWTGWNPDPEMPYQEDSFVRELRQRAAEGAETYMRNRHERGETTPREKELYDEFQKSLSAYSITQKYNLRLES